MKLELKHITPYLPFKLKCYEPRFNEKHTILGLIKNEIYIGDEDSINSFVLDDETFPILRPLSDLTKEIEVNGEKFYPLELIGKIIDNEYVGLAEDEDGIIIGKDVSPRCGCPYDCDCMSYTYNLFYKDFNFYSTVYQDGNPNDMVDEIVHESYLLMQKLIEWHFDVFGLIEKGLAVDINTLEK